MVVAPRSVGAHENFRQRVRFAIEQCSGLVVGFHIGNHFGRCRHAGRFQTGEMEKIRWLVTLAGRYAGVVSTSTGYEVLRR